MAKPTLNLDDMTPAERLELAQELWDSLDESLDAVPLTPEQAAELDRRLAAYRKDGNAGRPWPEVLAEIEARYQTP